MLGLKTKQELARDSFTLAAGNELVRYRDIIYIPADFETRETDVIPDQDRMIWLPLDREEIKQLAAEQFDTLFANDSELKNFEFMVSQNARYNNKPVTSLLVRTPEGLRQLTGVGKLEDPTGDFVPNTLFPMLNDDLAEKERIFNTIVEWVDSEEDAHSLLHHLATSLAPGWSAVKYVLLIGEGRNGKGVLLNMLMKLFGRENVSMVTRQHIAEQSAVVTELNGKLLNLVFDGRSEYLKDSGTEKSLVAGEDVPIRKLYDSSSTNVRTNALFIEGLNKEPKSNDKSSALQKRLVRFQFPNVYPLNKAFEKAMLNEQALGAFLSLLIDHYVGEDEIAEKLAPTQKAMALQLEHMYVNSVALQYLKHVEETDPFGVAGLVGMETSVIAAGFQSWRIKENDLGSWAEPDVTALFNPLLNTERKSVRVNGSPRKVRVVTSLKTEAEAFVDTLRGEEDDETEAAVVADGSV